MPELKPVDMAATTGEDEPRIYIDDVVIVTRYRITGFLLSALSGFLVGVVAGYVVWRLM